MKENREEALRQQEFIRLDRALVEEEAKTLGRQITYWIETFGCQMNAKDSEQFSGILEEIGYERAASEKTADFLLYNTCTVRENANEAKADKMYGLCEQFGWIAISMKNDWTTIYGEGVVRK